MAAKDLLKGLSSDLLSWIAVSFGPLRLNKLERRIISAQLLLASLSWRKVLILTSNDIESDFGDRHIRHLANHGLTLHFSA